jgi:hypothetical protein
MAAGIRQVPAVKGTLPVSKTDNMPVPKSSPLYTSKALAEHKRNETIRRADGAYRFNDDSVFVSKADRALDEQADAA